MAAKKLKNLCVRTGSYVDRNGQEKGKWLDVGCIMEGADGRQFIALSRAFNPAGVPNPENRDSVLISIFDCDRQEENDRGKNKNDGWKKNTSQEDDDIPF